MSLYPPPGEDQESADERALSRRLDALREYVACLHQEDVHTQKEVRWRLHSVLQPLQELEGVGHADLLQCLEPWVGRRAGDLQPPALSLLAPLLDELADVVAHLDGSGEMLRPAEEPLIYVQDVDASQGQHLAQQLKSMGYRVQVFLRLDALQASTLRRPPQVILLGPARHEQAAALDWIAALRAAQAAPPCILIGHDESFEEQLAAVRAGVGGYFSRPVHLAGLYQRLAQILSVEQGEAARVLLLSPQGDSPLLAPLAAAGLLVQSVSRGEMLFAGLSSLQPEVLLIDAVDSDSAMQWAGLVRLHDAWMQVPLLFYVAEGMAAPPLWQIADQVLFAVHGDDRLIASVRAHARRSRLLTQALTRDGLTGLLTQSEIKNRLATEIERSQRYGKPLSVALLEIDHFEDIRATYGHLIGDMVLRTLAHLLRNRVRRTDLLGRYGGETFIILLSDCALSSAGSLVEDLRQKFAALSLHPSLQDFFCTFSAGVSVLKGHESIEALLMRLDEARLEARRSGQNRLCIL